MGESRRGHRFSPVSREETGETHTRQIPQHLPTCACSKPRAPGATCRIVSSARRMGVHEGSAAVQSRGPADPLGRAGDVPAHPVELHLLAWPGLTAHADHSSIAAPLRNKPQPRRGPELGKRTTVAALLPSHTTPPRSETQNLQPQWPDWLGPSLNHRQVTCRLGSANPRAAETRQASSEPPVCCPLIEATASASPLLADR